MKKQKEINAAELTHMELCDFKKLILKNDIKIMLRGKEFCRVAEERKGTKFLKVMNYSEFTRSKKSELKKFMEKPGAVIKLITNAHKQKVCYLVK